MVAVAERQATIAYQPALDGVRAVAVVAVLLFHGQVSWMSGGYLGVSVFFTLSGFLITSLLVAEQDSTGTVRPSAFYARRMRRLLPASLLCLVLVCVFAAGGAFDGVANLRRDVVGAALQVFNWVQLNGGDSYAELFNRAGGTTPPLDHYWSLAIEEQFYWIWPVSFLGLTALARRSGWTLAMVLAFVTGMFAVAAPVIAAVWGPDAAYWATPARIPEILVGALLAVVIAGRHLPAWFAVLAPVCLAVIVIACATAPAGRGFAYEGLLPLFALASAGLIAGLQVSGPVRTALSVAPLVWIGKVSYGIYLFHWPVYSMISSRRFDLGDGALLAIRVAVTLVIAGVSFFVVEQPVRRARTIPVRTLVAGLAATAITLGAVAIVPARAAPYWGVDESTAESAGIDPADSVPPLVIQPAATTTVTTITATTTSSPTATATAAGTETTAAAAVTAQVAATSTTPTHSSTSTSTTPVPSRAVRIAVVGDSTAASTGGGLVQWAAQHPELAQVTLVTGPGCGFVLGGTRVFPDGEEDVDASCGRWVRDDIPDRIAELRPDVVMMMTTTWDVVDRRFGADEAVLSPVDPAMVVRIDEAFATLTATLLSAGAGRVVWVRQPVPDPFWLPEVNVQEDEARHGVLYAAMDRVAGTNPTAVRVVDLASWVTAEGIDDDHAARPDGVHWDPDTAQRIAADWLGQQLISAALTERP